MYLIGLANFLAQSNLDPNIEKRLPQILAIIVPLFKYVELIEQIEISKAEACKEMDSDEEDFFHRASDRDFLKSFLEDDLNSTDLQQAEKLGQKSIFETLNRRLHQITNVPNEEENKNDVDDDEETDDEDFKELRLKFTSEVTYFFPEISINCNRICQIKLWISLKHN